MDNKTLTTRMVELEYNPDAIAGAAALWADAKTDAKSSRRHDLLRDKIKALVGDGNAYKGKKAVEVAKGFFTFTNKHPAHVTPIDVKAWQAELETRGLASETVYGRISKVSSFYDWALKDPDLAQVIHSNPVNLARPKAPKAYQNEATQALADEEVRALVAVVRVKANSRAIDKIGKFVVNVEADNSIVDKGTFRVKAKADNSIVDKGTFRVKAKADNDIVDKGTFRVKADAGSIVGKRDLAMLLFYLLTGMRRREVAQLRWGDIKINGTIILSGEVKGGDYQAREVKNSAVKDALLDYLEASGRLDGMTADSPLWTRHDRAGEPGKALTSHAFVKNLKRYAKAAGIGDIHLHQTRHTFARIVAEETGSIIETQDALGHKNPATTRVYVQRIAVKKDKTSGMIAERIGL